MEQQHKALSLDELAVFVIDAFVLAAPDLIQRIGEMTHDVELVVDDLRAGGIFEGCKIYLESTGTVRIDDICPECREDLGIMSLLGFGE